ncbi:MAG: hypothetical protein J4F31_04650 [Flavobacteriales bacterium]|nr:hypothetical protein [Flavobacteriales bacterium]
MFRKILIGVLIFIVLLMGAILAVQYFISEDLPEGKRGPAAEELCDKMFKAVGREAWDSTAFARWTFRDAHHYVWNKNEHLVRVKWDEFTVYLYPETKEGRAFVFESELSGEDKEDKIQTAWDYFNNDSFWLIAPLKARDPGTIRELVQTDRGPALKVTYSSGGTTPGDTYLWHLDKDGKPQSWQMWVQIIPIGGLEFTWENWVATRTGVMIALDHEAEGFSVPLSGVDFAMTLSDLHVQDSLLVK